jgi:translocation and assembly module TamA
MRLTTVLLLTACLSGQVALAADPQPYTVKIVATGNKALDSTVKASSQLESLRKSAPAGPFAIIGRAQSDIERLQTVLESFGYYRRQVLVTISGKSLDDPTLPTMMLELPKSTPAEVQINIETGPLFHLRKITLEGDVSDAARAAFALESGTSAIAAQVLSAGQRLQDAMQEEGHTFARVDEPIAYEDLHDPVLDVTYTATPGPVYQLGAISFRGLKRVHEAFLRRRLKLRPGERYSASKVEHARADLLSLGVFSGVTVRLPKEEDATGGQVPIIFEVKERKRHGVGLTAAYSSDLGASGGATWTDRDAFGNGEQLALTANLINAGGANTKQLGYQVGAQLTKPNFLRNDQSLEYDLGLLRQDLDTYDQTAETAAIVLNRTLSARWKASIGLSVEHERIVQQEGVLADNMNPPPDKVVEIKPFTHYYTLLGIPITLKYDSTGLSNPLDDPLRGVRIGLSATPTESFNSTEMDPGTGASTTPRATFLILQGSVSTYFDLARFDWTRPGRSVFAARALAARAFGASAFSLPPDQRFYGGGSATVRGYSYQSIGPTLPYVTTAAGGTELIAGGIEFRQRLWSNFGVAAFVDSGAVTANTGLFEGSFRAFTQKLATGAGGGLRYYTPIGPVRLDVAVPLRRACSASSNAAPCPDVGSFQVYVGLGQAF